MLIKHLLCLMSSIINKIEQKICILHNFLTVSFENRIVLLLVFYFISFFITLLWSGFPSANRVQWEYRVLTAKMPDQSSNKTQIPQFESF